MKNFFRPYKIIFYVLSLITFLVLGTALSGLLGAGKNQGLAGGAIVLGYGLMTAFIALIIAIFVANNMKREIVVLLNKILLALFLFLISIATIRFMLREKPQQDPPKPRPVTKPASPAALAEIPATLITQAPRMGMGMAKPKSLNEENYYFYNPNFEKAFDEHAPAESFTISKNEQGYSLDSAPPWFVPEYNKMDYGILYFRLLSVSDDFLEVVTNKIDGRSGFISRHQFEIVLWPTFWLTVNSVEPINRQDNPVRIKPQNNASQKNIPFAFIKPLRVQGQWIFGTLQDDNFQKTGTGWIRWTDGENLLIRFSLLS